MQRKKTIKYIGKNIVLQTELNTTNRKNKESAHISLLDHLISPPILDISLIWTPIIEAEVRKLHPSH
jgi:hypothetical protein